MRPDGMAGLDSQMTWNDDIELEFEYYDKEKNECHTYYASARVEVCLKKTDIGPVGYRDHYESYVTQHVSVENLLVDDFGESIPEEIKYAAHYAFYEEASTKAEESTND